MRSQRTHSRTFCRKEISANWPSKIEDYGDHALNCDEFPFASTCQGSRYADPKYNFSVELIMARRNQDFGDALGAWYENNRIIRDDGFFMELK
ncbi:NucA/NucB deoxyribonuclease domain-containing protein [Streptosporangium roseum]|uniref:NucA/NucB deoxyribonuclease domain-containing protein n=1 Tax=Streptosporangium roseum TaxID=2001 RepID=UPI003D9E6609